MTKTPQNITVIGAGINGLVAASGSHSHPDRNPLRRVSFCQNLGIHERPLVADSGLWQRRLSVDLSGWCLRESCRSIWQIKNPDLRGRFGA
jgi:hypothetical protein